MNKQLSLDNIRSVLIRLEQNIIYSLTERALFKQNSEVYKLNSTAAKLPPDFSIMRSLLYETECTQAKVRRFTSPDEESFFKNLPKPILKQLDFALNPLRKNSVNINDKIIEIYGKNIIPAICEAGDDQQYGSCAVCDVNVLQNLSKRIHYGKFVAESKYRNNHKLYNQLIATNDKDGIWAAITDDNIEEAVLDRITQKSKTYCQEITVSLMDAQHIVQVYKQFIIPMTKDVQVAYLMEYKKDLK